MAKKALCVGINDYPYDGNDLNGCVNDAFAWQTMLTDHFEFPRSNVKVLTDSEATKANIMKGIDKLLKGASEGDILVFTNSSHGSYKADTSGDEPRYDEVLCPYDIADNCILDDELRGKFADMPEGVHLTVILDNCFSGTGTRSAVADLIPGFQPPDDRRMRFLSPTLWGSAILPDPMRTRGRSREKYPESGMKEVLLSGCTDRQVSYDAYIAGEYHGAMTYYAIKAIESANYRLTYDQLHTRLTTLIKDYPQSPQLEGRRENKKRFIFS